MASLNEVHLLDTTLVADNSLSWLVYSAVEVDDELIDEPTLALLEEVVEAALELLELEGLDDQLSLHLRSHPLVELKLLDD